MFRKRASPASSAAAPPPPTVAAILADVAGAKPDDVVFTTDLSYIDDRLRNFSDEPFEPQQRFRKESSSEESSGRPRKPLSSRDLQEDPAALYEKVIEHSQNVEKLDSLKSRLEVGLTELEAHTSEVQDNRDSLAERVDEVAAKLRQLEDRAEDWSEDIDKLVGGGGESAEHK